MTEKLFLTDYELLEHESVVVDSNEKSVVLEATLFHPQGGGQPTDFGTISSIDGKIVFIVKMAKSDRKTGIISHGGEFTVPDQSFQKGDKVILKVDEEKRRLHTFVHSGGHVLDVAVRNIGFEKWEPSRAYHFPKGAYVEYEMKGMTIDDREKFLVDLQNEIDRLADGNEEVLIRMVEYNDLGQFFKDGIVPHYLPKTKIRMVTYPPVTHPCEGTHIKKFSELKGHLIVRKLKKKKQSMRISYDIKM